MKRLFFICLLILVLIPGLYSESRNMLSVNTVPYGTIPLGSSAGLFNLGFGVEETVSFMPSLFRYFGITGGVDFILLPLESLNSIYALSGSLGPVFKMPLGDRFAVHADATIGYYYWGPINWDTQENNGGGLTVGGGVGASFQITGPLALGAGVAYDYYSKLYNGFSFSLSARLEFPVGRKINPYGDIGRGVESPEIRLMPLFPVLYKYYDNNPVGVMRIKNIEKEPAENVQVSFFVERYMDNPTEIGIPFTLPPEEERQIDLFGLFTEDLIGITEGTKVSAKISLAYTMEEESFTKDYSQVLEFYNRNALMWDDDRKIASFVTAKDPEIMGFAKNVMNWMQEVKNPAVDENFQKGIAVFEAIKNYGIKYEIDPTTPFSEFSEEKTTIDFLQFPRQTMQFTSGDCDDLTALYTSLLEAVGVETAVITIPGHIYAAFALKSPPDEALREFSKAEELIFEAEKAWIPVEITMFQESFEKAWQTGAKEWRENNFKEQSRFYPTRDSWQLYQAVGFREGAEGIALPDKDTVLAGIENDVTRHVEKEIYPQVSQIQSRMEQSKDKYKFENKLGVLYARYGFYDRSLEYFQKVLETREYKPALINIGNLHFKTEDYIRAMEYYQQVLNLDDNNKSALLGIARCHHELENFGFVSAAFGKLKAIDSDLAERFAYLDIRGEEGARAADAAGIRRYVIWEEEE